ncbi:uncharacterized protein [Rutidosis leptorrhynchoides]|uniref:uncharacterized protein n=1 Tax=Rutidosis leptorrhynchoides TaxID=125765 RepID=UPI003A99A0B0
MDPKSAVLEISSDEEGGWENNINKGISTDSFDDHNWIADLLDEVNRDNCGYNEDDDGGDSDEVVVVSEYLRKPKKKVVAKCSSLVEFDDDCMILDHDPDKPLDARNDNPVNRDEDDENDDDDDVLVVSEKGQVACRDYPHSRHLCIKFPFSSSPNQSHCEQCYCYVCDSLAPCVYWGDGSYSLDHCQATDKGDFWIIERQNSKNGSKIADTSLSNQLPVMNLVPPPVQNQVTTPNPIQTSPISSNFGAPHIINQNQTPFISSSNKYEPSLVSQQLIRSNSCTIPTDRVYRNYDLGTTLHKPVFKRTVSAGFVPASNRYSYHRDGYRNLSLHSNVVNASVPFSLPNLSFEDSLPRRNITFDFSQNSNPIINQDSCVEPPVPNVFLPHAVSFSSQVHSSLPNYSVPNEVPRQEYQGQKSTVDSKFFHGVSWQESQTGQQPATQSSVLECANLTNEPSLATGSGGLVDYGFDNWMFNNEPCQPGSIDVSGTYGLNELSPEPAFIDTENNPGCFMDSHLIARGTLSRDHLSLLVKSRMNNSRKY